MTSTPDEIVTASREPALAALHEITPASTVGPFAGHTVEESGALSLRFENRLPGYPGWYWTVSVAQLDDAEPSVLEVELMPGESALLAPDWVPWAERLADYRAHQAELAEQAAAAGVETEDSDADDDADADARAAAWSLTSVRVAKSPDGLDLDGLLDRIESELRDAPSREQWAMNETLAYIGIHHPALRERALEIGERLQVLADHPTPPNCTSPFAPLWIAEMVRRKG